MAGIPSLIYELCCGIARQNLLPPLPTDHTFTSFVLPDHNTCNYREDFLRYLRNVAFDLLLLRSWEWFGGWKTAMSPADACQSFTVRYHMCGLHEEAGKLKGAVELLCRDARLQETEAVLKFLALLAREDAPDQIQQPLSQDSGVFCYDTYPSSLFTGLPSLLPAAMDRSQPLSITAELFECSPCAGFENIFCPKGTATSALFDGLIHCTLTDINTPLDLPALPSSAESINLLHGVHTARHRTHVSRMPAVRVDGDEAGDEREKVGLGPLLECTDALPAKTWVGRVAMTHYLTESEGDTFSRAVNLALTTTAQVANVDPQSLLQSRDWSPVQSRQLLKDLQNALQNPLQHLDGKSSVSRSHAQGIRTLLHYCQCRLHELGDGKSDLYLEWASNRIVPIVKFLLRLVAAHPSQPEGLALIDALFTQAQRAQCTFLYPLLLGLLRQAMLPYLQYIHVWVFDGFLGDIQEFGIEAQPEHIRRRDHTFWTEGYRLVSENSCAPHFLAHLATPILTCGKGLNLLKLCNPSHPLCTRMFQPPPLCVPVTLEKMKSLGEQCEAYRMSVMQLCASIQEKQEAKMMKVEQNKQDVVAKGRRDAKSAMNRIKEMEEIGAHERETKKKALFEELKMHMEQARALRAEKASQEREVDRLLTQALSEKEANLSDLEKRLAQEAKEELVAYYDRLSQDAERRQIMAVWQSRRLALGNKRRAMLMEEGVAVFPKIKPELVQHQPSRDTHEPDSKVKDISHCQTDLSDQFQSSRGIHEPDSAMKDVLYGQSNQSDQYQSSRGTHEPDSAMKDVLYGQSNPSDEYQSSRGTHEPDSAMKDVHYGQSNQSDQYQSSRGTHEPDSEMKDILYGQSNQSDQYRSSRGTHEPDSAMKDVLYGQSNQSDQYQSSRGTHEPDSAMKDVLYGQSNQSDLQYQSSRGTNEPHSALKDVLYPQSNQPDQCRSSVGAHKPTDTSYTRSSSYGALASTIQHLLYPGKWSSDMTGTATVSPSAPSNLSLQLETIPAVFQHYQDDYTILDELPGTKTSSGLFCLQSEGEENVDETSITFTPLGVLLEHCLVHPVFMQLRLIDSALLEHLTRKCDIVKHFTALKLFLLMEDGEFAHTLTSVLFEELTNAKNWTRICSASFLNGLLSRALDSSLQGSSLEAARLSFATSGRHHVGTLSATSVNAMNFLELNYKVDWPCNVVIHPGHIQKYNRVFHFLLQVRRASWALKNTATYLKHSCITYSGRRGYETRCLSEIQHRQLQLQRHELQHFSSVMHDYIANQLFNLSWQEFEHELHHKVHGVDELIHAHQSFIERAIFRCLLSRKAQPVMKIIVGILTNVLHFTDYARLDAVANYEKMCEIHAKFREALSLLLKVITKLVARGYQPHLDDYLLRLNFNGFYSH